MHPKPAVLAELPRSSGKFSWPMRFEEPLSKVNIPKSRSQHVNQLLCVKWHLHWKINSKFLEHQRLTVMIPSSRKENWDEVSGHERRKDLAPTATERSDSARSIQVAKKKKLDETTRLPDFEYSRLQPRITPRFRQTLREISEKSFHPMG